MFSFYSDLKTSGFFLFCVLVIWSVYALRYSHKVGKNKIQAAAVRVRPDKLAAGTKLNIRKAKKKAFATIKRICHKTNEKMLFVAFSQQREYKLKYECILA